MYVKGKTAPPRRCYSKPLPDNPPPIPHSLPSTIHRLHQFMRWLPMIRTLKIFAKKRL
jgi:hypothetical protein